MHIGAVCLLSVLSLFTTLIIFKSIASLSNCLFEKSSPIAPPSPAEANTNFFVEPIFKMHTLYEVQPASKGRSMNDGDVQTVCPQFPNSSLGAQKTPRFVHKVTENKGNEKGWTNILRQTKMN